MTRLKAIEYAKSKFPELPFDLQMKIATAYIDGCIDTVKQLAKDHRDN